MPYARLHFASSHYHTHLCARHHVLRHRPIADHRAHQANAELAEARECGKVRAWFARALQAEGFGFESRQVHLEMAMCQFPKHFLPSFDILI